MTTKPALLPFSGYLILTAPLAFLSLAREGLERLPLVAVHLGLCLVLVWLLFRSGYRLRSGSSPGGSPQGEAGGWEWTSWLALLVIPFLYWELPVLNQTLVQGYLDPWVSALELRVFPGDPSASLAGSWPSPLLSEGLHLAYLSYYPLIIGPPLVWWLGGRRDLFHESVFRLTLTFSLCYLLFVIFPVEGPRYGGVPPAGIPEGMVRGWTLSLLEGGSARGTAFPSSHVAVALTQAFFLFKHSRWVGTGSLLLALCLSVGAIYGGFHYGVDVLAGASLAVVLGWALNVGSPSPPIPPEGTTLPT